MLQRIVIALRVCVLWMIVLSLDGGVVRADEDIGLCCLCKNCGPPVSGRGDMFVDNKGTTCTDLVLEMADNRNDSQQGNSKCNQMKNQYYNTCCNPNFSPSEVKQTGGGKQSQYPKGPWPVCHLCHERGYPSKPNTVTSTLGIPGNPTCEDLYYMGLQGSISDQLCNPLQDAYDVPCGCYDRNPAPGGASPSQPRPSPPSPPTGPSQPSSGYPDKKDPPAQDKDDTKMSGERERGATNTRMLESDSRLRGRQP